MRWAELKSVAGRRAGVKMRKKEVRKENKWRRRAGEEEEEEEQRRKSVFMVFRSQ